MTLVRALDREEAPSVQVVVTVTDDVPANIVALPRTIRGEYRLYNLVLKACLFIYLSVICQFSQEFCQ